MIIREVEISNFRSIKHQVINNIDNILVLIGKNNSGKSALLQAINTFWGNYSIDEDDFYKNKNIITNRLIPIGSTVVIHTLCLETSLRS